MYAVISDRHTICAIPGMQIFKTDTIYATCILCMQLVKTDTIYPILTHYIYYYVCASILDRHTVHAIICIHLVTSDRYTIYNIPHKQLLWIDTLYPLYIIQISNFMRYPLLSSFLAFVCFRLEAFIL